MCLQLRGRRAVKKLDFLQIIGAKDKRRNMHVTPSNHGGDEEDRTPGLGIANGQAHIANSLETLLFIGF
jgi:hypothetical protein